MCVCVLEWSIAILCCLDNIFVLRFQQLIAGLVKLQYIDYIVGTLTLLNSHVPQKPSQTSLCVYLYLYLDFYMHDNYIGSLYIPSSCAQQSDSTCDTLPMMSIYLPLTLVFSYSNWTIHGGNMLIRPNINVSVSLRT